MTKRPTILVDGHVFDGHFQGTRTYIGGLYRALAGLGRHRILVAMENREVFEREFGGVAGIDHVPFPSMGTGPRLFVHFPRLVRRLSPDLSHFQYVGPVPCPGRLMITTHDLLFLDFPRQFPLGYRLARTWTFRHFARRADILLTVSEYSRRQISQRFGIDPARIGLVRNALDDAFFQPVDRKSCVAEVRDRFGLEDFVLFVGRVEPRKNHAALVRAMEESGAFARGRTLVFLGKRDLTATELESELARLPDEHRARVLFFEGIGNEDLRKFYAACGLFVFPSLGEGFGIPVLEAAASGAPVLCSNATAMGDFPFPDRCFFDPRDPAALDRKLSEALATPDSHRVAPAVFDEFRWAESARSLAGILAREGLG